MKKIVLTFTLLSIIYYSCHKDNDTINSSNVNNQTQTHPSQQILGIWKFVKYVDTILKTHHDPITYQTYYSKCALTVNNISYPSLYIVIKKKEENLYFIENYSAVFNFTVYIYKNEPYYPHYVTDTCLTLDFNQLCDNNNYVCQLTNENYFFAPATYTAYFGKDFKFSTDYHSIGVDSFSNYDIRYKIVNLTSSDLVLEEFYPTEYEYHKEVFYFKRVSAIGQ